MVIKTQAPAPAADAQSPAPSRLLGSLRWARHRLRALRTENRPISRYVFNAAPVYRYRRVADQQPAEVRRVVDELRASGVALTSMSSLRSSDASLPVLQDHVARTRAERTAERDSLKPYLIELFGAQPEISPADPVFAFALLPQVRGVAEAYAQMELRVQDINVWINLPTGGGPTQSQRWHRDLPDDYDIVKCFVYLADVTPGAGPLQYIRSTNTPEGRRQSFRSEFDGVGYRVADDDIEGRHGGGPGRDHRLRRHPGAAPGRPRLQRRAGGAADHLLVQRLRPPAQPPARQRRRPISSARIPADGRRPLR